VKHRLKNWVARCAVLLIFGNASFWSSTQICAQELVSTQPLPFTMLLSDEADASLASELKSPISEKLPLALEDGPSEKEAASDKEAVGSKDKDTDVVAMRKRLDELEKAEKKRSESEKKKEDEAKKKEDEEKQLGDWADMSTDKWTVKLGGHVQADYINWVNPDSAIPSTEDNFQFRRLRLVADGAGYGVYDFRLQMTLEPDPGQRTLSVIPSGGGSPVSIPATVTTPQVKDAYFSINELPGLGRLRVGNFFVPFSLEQVTNDTNNIFLERSIPTQGVFAADRQVGIAAYNATDDKKLTWTTGAFFAAISESLKERIDNNQGLRLSGRGTWLPYYDEASNGRYLVHTGAGVLYTDNPNNQTRLSARPQINEGPRIIDSGLLNASSTTTGNLEFATVWGQFAFQSEGFLSNVDLATANSEMVRGGYAHVSYFLTGENRIFERFGQHGAQFGRNVPYSNVFATPGGRGWGAWEAKARYSNLDLNSLNRGVYDDFTIGMNWYWSDRVRMMFDYIHPITSSTAVFGATQSDIIGTRFDFNW